MAAAASSEPLRAYAKACGKVILLGEHFVVPYGESADAPAIALPLRSLSCEVEITLRREGGCIAEGVPSDVREAVETKMAHALKAAASALRIDPRSLEVRSRATFPLSRGFGSSASFSVALTRALDALVDEASRPREHGVAVRDLDAVTHAVESIFHGSPSGLDTAVILAERAIRFHRGRLVRFVPHTGVELVAVDSGPRDAAASLIGRIKELRARSASNWARMATRMTELVDRCEAALSQGHAVAVGKIASEAHGILAELGLTGPRIEKILGQAMELGALGGKVSGAGAGGAVILVTRAGDGARLARALGSHGHSVVAVSP